MLAFTCKWCCFFIATFISQVKIDFYFFFKVCSNFFRLLRTHCGAWSMLSSYLLVAIIPWYVEGTLKKVYFGETKIRHLINHNNILFSTRRRLKSQYSWEFINPTSDNYDNYDIYYCYNNVIIILCRPSAMASAGHEKKNLPSSLTVRAVTKDYLSQTSQSHSGFPVLNCCCVKCVNPLILFF